jgi:hypothetical protein
MEEEILVCSECGAKIKKKHLEYANKNEQFPHDCDHLEECGCIIESLNYDGECNCKFVSK